MSPGLGAAILLLVLGGVLAVPLILLWFGGVLRDSTLRRPRVALAAVLGFLAPPLLIRWLGRPFVEQIAALALSTAMVGSGLLGRDSGAFAAFGLVGAVWGAWLAIREIPVEAQAPAPAARRIVGPPPLFPAAPPPSPPADTDSGEEFAFRLTLRCPTCGAEVAVPVYHRMARCPFCDSTHAVIHAERALVAVIPDTLEDEAGLRSAVAKHFQNVRYLTRFDQVVRPLLAERTIDAQAEQARAVIAPEGSAVANAAEAAIRLEAEAYGQRVAGELVVVSWQRFLAPYRHRLGTLYQAAFGRDESGEKRLDFMVTTVETSVAASATALPEMGKLSYLRTLRPLQGAPEESLPALPITLTEAEFEDRMRRLSGRTAELSIRALAQHATLVSEVDAVVYRPFHDVEIELEGERYSVLLEGGGGSVVGRPPAWASAGMLPPAPPGAPPTLAASRCPECGADLAYAPDAVAHLCRNCLRVVVNEGNRWHPRSYLHDRPGRDSCVLPFWRFPLRMRMPSGALVTDLGLLTDGVDGRIDQAGSRPPRNDHVFVPAFRTRVSRAGVRLYRHLWPLVQSWPRDLTSERMPLDAPPRDVAEITLPEDEARTFAHVYLALAFTRRDLARSDARNVRDLFLSARLEGAPELAYLTVPREVVEPFRFVFGRPRPAAVARLEGT